MKHHESILLTPIHRIVWDDSHMPPNHQEYSQWNGDRFRAWAAKISMNTAVVVEALFAGYKVEQQGYHTCMSLLKLSEQYTPERLEAACGAEIYSQTVV